MWTYQQVKAADAVLIPLVPDPAQAATTLNAQTTSTAVDLNWSAIRDVLMNNFDWATLTVAANTAIGAALPGGTLQTAAIRNAAIAIRECCLYGGVFQSSNATVWGRLTSASALLTPAGVGAISQASATAINGMRVQALPSWVPQLDAGTLQSARAMP